MRGPIGRWAAGLVVAAVAAANGCVSPQPPGLGLTPPVPPTGVHGQLPVAVPPPGTVPTEMAMVTLPPYVISPPDNLVIQVVTQAEVPERDKDGKEVVDPKTGKTVKTLKTNPLPVQDISGSFLVNPTGSVVLGSWGEVTVAGLSLEQAAAAIRQHLVRHPTLAKSGIQPESLIVVVDVLAYNSKRYYVITDGGGYGEQVFPFPITGGETVLDALAYINGLPAVASRRNIWVARRCPHPNQPWQILPVDWVGITQHGLTETNYQILPGDRVYVKAQRLITIDTALARALSPVERLFGVTLLGSSTVNQIRNRGNNGSNTGN